MPSSESCVPLYRAKHSRGRHACPGVTPPVQIMPLIASTGRLDLLTGIADVAEALIGRGLSSTAAQTLRVPLHAWDPSRTRSRSRYDDALAGADAVLLLVSGDEDSDDRALTHTLDISTRGRRGAWKDMPVAVVAAAERSELALEYAVHKLIGIGAAPAAGVWLQPSRVLPDPRIDRQVHESLSGVLGALALMLSLPTANAGSISRPRLTG